MSPFKTTTLTAGLLVAVAWVGGATLHEVGASQKGVTVYGERRGDRAEKPEKPDRDGRDMREDRSRRRGVVVRRRAPERAQSPEQTDEAPQAEARERPTTDSNTELVAHEGPCGTVAFYSFGGSGAEAPGHNRRLMRSGSWQAWAQETLEGLPEGCTRVWLHNPFGLYEKPGGDRWMWIDQWELAKEVMPEHMTDPEAFAEAVQILRDGGVVEVVAYVGSPLTLPPELRTIEHVETLLEPMLLSGCSIAFDATYDWRKGDEIDTLIQAIRGRGHRVYVEPWLFGDREYGPIDGVVHADRFFSVDVPRTRMRGIPIAQDPDCERVVIQRGYSASDLEKFRTQGATLAVRPWTTTGRALAAE